MEAWQEILGEPFWSSRVLLALSLIKQVTQNQRPFSVAVSFNGGKDATVLWHLCRSLNLDLVAAYFEEQDPFDELIAFTNSTLTESSLQVIRLPQDYKEGMGLLVSRGVTTVLMGVRQTDPSSPRHYYEMSSEGWPVFLRVYPLLEWSYKDIWYFLKKLELPYCSLYDIGYTSLGAKGKTRPNPRLAGGPAWELTDETAEREGRSKL